MKAFILCLYIATSAAWRPGVYILDDCVGTASQYYNPLTQPYSQPNLPINFRVDRYGVEQTFTAKAKCALLLVDDVYCRHVLVETL